VLALQLALLLLVALVPAIVLVIRLRNAELSRREPWRVLWRAFGWGAVFAAGIAIVAERFLDARFDSVLLWPAAPALTVSIVLVAPLVEELAKAAGLGIIDDRDPEPEDGYIYGGAVGLGFAATENAFYVLNAFLLSGESGAFTTALYRGLVTVPLHGAVSAIAGYGIWQARYGGRRLAAVWALAAAFALHAAYNALAATQLAWAALLAAALAVVAYLRITRRVVVLDAR
jgi:RsiW-degrading membrane proteinase PrsW (M82 family)